MKRNLLLFCLALLGMTQGAWATVTCTYSEGTLTCSSDAADATLSKSDYSTAIDGTTVQVTDVTKIVIGAKIKTIANDGADGTNDTFKGMTNVVEVDCQNATDLTTWNSSWVGKDAKGTKFRVTLANYATLSAISAGGSTIAGKFDMVCTLTAQPGTGTYKDLYFTSLYYDQDVQLPETKSAYIGTAVDGNNITLGKIGRNIPKNTGVIIASGTESIEIKVGGTYSATTTGNKLTGTTEGVTAEEDKYYAFGLGTNGGDKVFGFWRVNNVVLIPAYKAYYKVSGSPSSVKFFSVTFDDDALTGIQQPETSVVKSANGWYDLNGRQLTSKPATKGIYVNNGKKVVIK